MNIQNIKTLGELKKSGYKPLTVKEKSCVKPAAKNTGKENTFSGIIGYEDSVIPDTERAMLSRHNILFLGFARTGKTRMARQMTGCWMNTFRLLRGSEVNDDPMAPLSKHGRDLIAQHGDETPIVDTPQRKIWRKACSTGCEVLQILSAILINKSSQPSFEFCR